MSVRVTDEVKIIPRDELKIKFYLPHDDKQVVNMLKEHGHSVTFNRKDYYDALLFTGGEDVHPLLYGEKVHVTTSFNLRRDMNDIKAFRDHSATIPKVGICRGAQFLNVMSGGTLYQHVDKHAIAIDHEVVSAFDPSEVFPVSSTHHQMMRPGIEGFVLLEADESTIRYTSDEKFVAPHFDESDVEAVYYCNTNSMCIQFHPEFRGAGHPCREWFFSTLYDYFGTDISRRRHNAGVES